MNDKLYFRGKVKENQSAILALSILQIFISVSMVFFSWLTKYLIDSIQTNTFWIFASLLVLIIMIEIVLKIICTGFSNKKINRLEADLKEEVFHEMLKKDYQNIKKNHDSTLLSYIISDCRIIADSVIQIIPNVISLTSKIVLSLLLLFCIDPVFSGFLLTFGLLIFLLSRFLRKKNKSLHMKMQQAEAQQIGFYQDSILNFLVLKVFGKSKRFQDKEKKINDNLYQKKNDKTKFNILINSGFLFFLRLSYLFAIVYGIYYLNEKISIGELFAMIQLIQLIEIPFTNLSGMLPRYYSTLASIERILSVYHLPNEINKIQISSFSTIDVDHISFSYQNKSVIDDLSFQICKNDFVVIKGESGSGKSTFIRLLLGLYEPDQGRISFDQSYKVKEAEQIFAIVPQENFIFDGTLKENLLFFCNDSDEEKIKKYLEFVGLSQFSNQLETYICNLNKGLSEGEIQRLCIARALLAERPILVLDEATSAQDKQNEEKLLDNLSALDKTIIFVSHKDKTLEYATKVLELTKVK